MNIEIIPGKKIEEIQSEFSKRFPYLKINFFTIKPKDSKGYSKPDIIDSSKRIMDVTDIQNSTPLHLNGLMSVAEVEKNAREQIGLHIEIFRKSGKVWLKTSSSDHWTLDEQNKEALESEMKITEKPEETDYHEQE